MGSSLINLYHFEKYTTGTRKVLLCPEGYFMLNKTVVIGKVDIFS